MGYRPPRRRPAAAAPAALLAFVSLLLLCFGSNFSAPSLPHTLGSKPGWSGTPREKIEFLKNTVKKCAGGLADRVGGRKEIESLMEGEVYDGKIATYRQVVLFDFFL